MRSKHEAYLTARWVAQETKRLADSESLSFSDVPIAKYRNRPVGKYASQKEAKRAAELKLLEKAGAIRNLREQVSFELIPKQDGERACRYVVDFLYEEEPKEPGEHGWQLCAEDVKGYRTDLYRVKRKLMLLIHGLRIRET